MYRIIQFLDPRFPNQDCIVKPEKVEKIYLVQSIDENNHLLAIAIINDIALIFNAGYMNFYSDHGGRNVLNDFRIWLIDNKIDNIELKYITEFSISEMRKNKVFDSSIFIETHKNLRVEKLFNIWIQRLIEREDYIIA